MKIERPDYLTETGSIDTMTRMDKLRLFNQLIDSNNKHDDAITDLSDNEDTFSTSLAKLWNRLDGHDEAIAKLETHTHGIYDSEVFHGMTGPVYINIGPGDKNATDYVFQIAEIQDRLKNLERDSDDEKSYIRASDGGHWVCSACGKDWGKGRIDWVTGFDVHVCFSLHGQGGCGQWAVKWIPGETILPEHAHRIKDLDPAVVQAVTDNFDELIDTPDPTESTELLKLRNQNERLADSRDDAVGVCATLREENRTLKIVASGMGHLNTELKDENKELEAKNVSLEEAAHKYEMNAETYKAEMDRLEAKVYRQRGNLNHLAAVEDRNTELETENKVLTERMAQYEEAVSRMETIIGSYDRLEPEDCDEGLISVNNLKGCLAALTSKGEE